MVDPKLVAASAISLAVSLFAIFSLRPIARRFGLTDRPDARKQHSGRIPLIGGLCFFLGTLAGLCYLGYLDNFTLSLVTGSVLIVAVGAVDDFHDLSVRTRLVVEMCVVGWVIAMTGYYVDGLGPLFGSGEFHLGWLGIPVTVVAVIGLINAYNMLDGIDGLAAAMAMAAIGSVLLMGNFAGGHPGALLFLEVLFAALIPYVCVNLGWPDGRKVFMGDAGSTLIGFVLAWGLIYLSHDSVRRLAPVDVLWCVALPVMDTLAVMYRRMRQGKSPFKPDRQHLHHLLLDAGFAPRAALLVIVAVAGLLTAFGYALRGAPGVLGLLAFVAVTVLYMLWGERAVAMAGRANALLFAPKTSPDTAGATTTGDEVALGDDWRGEVQVAGINSHSLHLLPDSGRTTHGNEDSETTRMRMLCVAPSAGDAIAIASIMHNMVEDDRFEPALCAERAAEPVLEALDLHADFNLRQSSGEVTASSLHGMERLLGAARPDAVLVPVNSPAAVATSLAARACDIPVVCIGEEPRTEASATHDIADAGRRIVRTLAALHVTSSESTGRELIAAGVPAERVLVARDDEQVLEALSELGSAQAASSSPAGLADRDDADPDQALRKAS